VLKAVARAREAKAKRALRMMSPVLCDRRIPRPERVMVAKAFLVPVVMYGAELWGGRRAVVRPLELLLNRMWSMVLGVPRTSSLFCARHAVRAQSARAMSLVASARAMAKWRSLRSWVSEFVRAPYRRRIAEPDWVWSRSVNVSLRAASDEGDIAAAAAAAQVEATKRAATKAATRAEIKEDGSMAGDLWRRYDLDGTVGEARKLALAGSDVNNWSVRQMDRMRAGVFNTTQRLARCEFVSGMWRAQCPYCLQPVPEDLAHFLLECPEWRSARMRFIMPVLRRAGCGGWIGNVERRQDLVYILLGGKLGRCSAVSLSRARQEDKEAKQRAERGGEGDRRRGVAVVVAAGAGAGAADVGAVAEGVPGHAAVVRREVKLSKSLRSSGLNFLVGVSRFLRAVWSDRTARGPPLSRRRPIGGMAELGAPGGRLVP
jgi:hypothetical protein